MAHSSEPQNDIPTSRRALQEALDLSAEILKNIELSELPLVNVTLKGCRLARLLNDMAFLRVFELEVSGYGTYPDGLPLDLWGFAELAGRTYLSKDRKTDETKSVMFPESIAQLEEDLMLTKVALEASQDADISITSANPNQYVSPNTSNNVQRNSLRVYGAKAAARLGGRKMLGYNYALQRHYELKYSQISDDVFSRIRLQADSRIGKVIPDATKKLAAVYENLLSDNPENWALAVHSCRRILQDLADELYPARNEPLQTSVDGKMKEILLGAENYINRLVAYVSTCSESKTFTSVVGSHLRFLGERLDSIFDASQKGSHRDVSRDEADRYVVYTYLLVGDILSLESGQVK
jgi:hypothetical protein